MLSYRLLSSLAIIAIIIKPREISVQALSSSPLTNLFDRFQAVCPADTDCIRQFQPSLVDGNDDDDDSVWVAVFRSNNNQPSVLVKDEFLHAMRAAVDPAAVTRTSSNNSNNKNSNKDSGNLQSSFVQTSATATPVAVARLLRQSSKSDDDGCYVLDNMRCVLKKESTDETCDGGSEHTEALGTAIDTLLLHYLTTTLSSLSTTDDDDDDTKPRQRRRFTGAIRTKATLVSGVLLEARGFRPIEKLSQDMATHTSGSIDACLAQYAERSVNTNTSGKASKSPAAMQRALDIVTALGRLADREAEDGPLESNHNAAASGDGAADDSEEEEDDPWSAMKRFL